MAYANAAPLKKHIEILKLMAITGKPVIVHKANAGEAPSAMLYTPYSKNGYEESSVEILFFTLESSAVEHLIAHKHIELQHEFLDEAHYALAHKGRNAVILSYCEARAETNIVQLAAHAAS